MTFAPAFTDPASSVRLAVDGGLIVAGGADGVVKLFRSARWSIHAQPVWSAKVHDGAVTSVVVNAKAGFAFTAGRDGHVYRHDITVVNQNGSSAAASSSMGADDDTTTTMRLERSRVVCRVSGEINVLVLDDVRMHLFVAGDTLRYITLGERPAVSTVAIQLAPPIVATALSPCGQLVAAASGATGDVCVFGLCPPPSSDATQQTTLQASQHAAAVDEVPFPFSGTKFNLRNATPKHWRREGGEAFACTLSWCRIEPESSMYLLAVPTDDGVRMLRFTPPGGSNEKPTLHMFHTVSIDKLRLLTCARLLTHTKQDVTLVVTGQEEGSTVSDATADNEEAHLTAQQQPSVPTTYVVKCSLKRNSVASQQTIGQFRCTSAVSDTAVDAHAGHLCIATVGGELAFVKSAVPVPRKPRTTSGVSGREGNVSSPAEGAPKKSTDDKKKPVAPTHLVDDDDDSEGGSDASDDDDEDNDERPASRQTRHVGTIGGGERAEDLGAVVSDLMRSKQHVLSDGSKRATAIRTGKGVVSATGSSGGHRVVPAYLDDEAEEAEESSVDDNAGDVDSEDQYDETDDHLDGGDGTGSGDDMAEEEGGQSNNPLLFHSGKTSALPTTAAVAAAPRDYSFQPGATPLKEVAGASSESCYFSYNSIGCIRYGGDGTFVQFHDVARASIKLQEKGRVLMASMGASGAAFVLDIRGTAEASEVEETTGVDAPEMLYFRTYAALGAQADWRLPLLVGESCRCLAVGLRFVAVATNVALRIFSLSGLEMAVLSLSSRIVCMVGCNSTRLAQSLKYDQDPLAIVSLVGGGGGGGLECTVLNCHNSTVTMAPTACPVTSDPEFGDHYLQWLGWSDDGPLHTCDSAGVVRMFTRDWGGSWVPVYDPRHFTSDSVYRYWIWSVTDQHMFVYKTSRGEHGEDHFPVASASHLPMDQVRLCLPLLRTSLSTAGEKRMLLRDRFLRTMTKVNELKRTSAHYTEQIAKQDVAHDAKLMEQFKAALKDQETSRAVDLATMFELRDSVEEAARHANQEGFKSVVLKLVAIVDMRHKLKLKRNCPLPLESQDISDKERDQVLKKLLMKEKERLKEGPAGGPSSAPSAAGTLKATPPSVQVPVALQKHVRLEAETLHAQEATPEEAATTTTTRRTVVFDTAPPQQVVTAPSKAPPSSASSSLILGAGPSVPSKVAPTPQLVAKQASPLLHSVKAEPPRFGKPAAQSGSGAAVAPHSAPPTAAPIGALGAASAQPAVAPPEASKQTLLTVKGSAHGSPPSKTRAVSRPSTSNDRSTDDHSAKSDNVNPPTAAKSLMAAAVVSAPPPPRRGEVAAAVPNATTAVPTPFETPAPSFVDLPVDPFLQPGEDGTRVERAVRDVGHADAGDSSQVVPKTLSFGEALRKRYREEEEDDDDDAADRRSLTGLFQ